jgi:von Willebrand factor type A domain-containing protein
MKINWLGLAILACLPFAGCQGSDAPSVVSTGSAGSGAGGGPQLTLPGNGGGSNEAGAAGASVGPGVEACESFDGLDQCGVTSVEASFSAANVLLVIDKSSSMDDQPKGFELKKWDALKASLEATLEQASDELSFGLLLYPFGAQAKIPLDCFDGCCEVPIGPAAVQVPIATGERGATEVMQALAKTSPGGGTPTADALAAALTYFTTGDGKSLKGDRYVLLATDGGPNCGSVDSKCNADRCTPNLDGLCPDGNCCAGEGAYCLDDVAVVKQLEALAAAGIPTFVVGIPGTEKYAQYLEAFAVGGGVTNPKAPPSYYAVSADGGVDQLTRTFVDITTHLVRSCEVDLGQGPADERLVNVAVDCQIVPFADGSGWSIEAEDPTKLLLAGDACEQLQNQGARRVDVVYGCPTIK